MARWFARRLFRMPSGDPLVSFTFDDFPRSALLVGGEILREFRSAGTFYGSLGLMNRMTPTGEMFRPDDISLLLEREHELGCHTFDHCPAWQTGAALFEASVVRNAEALRRVAPEAPPFLTHAYPIEPPRPDTKRGLSRHFACCRGGGQTFNAGTVDVNYLSAFFLEQARDHPDIIRETIAKNCQAGGWLIFATHDVSHRPTRFGCTPELLANTIRFALESGCRVLPVFKAWEIIRERATPKE